MAEGIKVPEYFHSSREGKYSERVFITTRADEKSGDGMMESFECEGKKIELFESGKSGCPLVVLNTFSGEAKCVWQKCREIECPTFTLACISGMDWNADLSPWEIPPLRKNDRPFSGKADLYVKFIEEKALPAILQKLSSAPTCTVLAGYSLAGLFALYAPHKTKIFPRIVAASPSAWFPRFVDFVKSTPFEIKPDRIYLSLGDRESKTKNPLLSTVQANAENLENFYTSQKIKSIFELNDGNHFVDNELRLAKGIRWVLGE